MYNYYYYEVKVKLEMHKLYHSSIEVKIREAIQILAPPPNSYAYACITVLCTKSMESVFLHPTWWAKPASWGVLRLFWITCMCIYNICLHAYACITVLYMKSMESIFLHPTWWAKPTRWGVLRLF